MTSTRYWMAEPGGTPEGPYDIETLREFRAQGRVGPNTQLCPDGGMAWRPANDVLGPREFVDDWASPNEGRGLGAPPMASAGRVSPEIGGRRPVSLVGPIVATVLGICSPCCAGVVLGAVSIQRAATANEALRRGDVLAYDDAARVANICMIIAFVLAAIGCVLNGIAVQHTPPGTFP